MPLRRESRLCGERILAGASAINPEQKSPLSVGGKGEGSDHQFKIRGTASWGCAVTAANACEMGFVAGF